MGMTVPSGMADYFSNHSVLNRCLCGAPGKYQALCQHTYGSFYVSSVYCAEHIATFRGDRRTVEIRELP